MVSVHITRVSHRCEEFNRLFFFCNFQNEEYRSKSLDNVLKSYELLESTNWKLDKTTTCGDKIYYINRKPYGKVYRITADIEYPAKELFESLVTGVEQMPKWNPTLIESRVLRVKTDYSAMYSRLYENY